MLTKGNYSNIFQCNVNYNILFLLLVAMPVQYELRRLFHLMNI